MLLKPNPWCESEKNQVSDFEKTAEFEDNFEPYVVSQRLSLPDSKEYLESLESKLRKLKKDTNAVQQVAAKRELCMERLLRGSIELPTSADFGIDDIDTEENIATALLRHIRPQQPLNSSELVNIVKFDELANTAATADEIETNIESDTEHSDTEQTTSR